MREIKFRAWDNEEKRFWNFDLQKILERQLAYMGSWDRKIAIGDKMQFTGLKDVNEVEIYEGDIVRYYSLYYGKKILGAVVFEDGGFYVGECSLHKKKVEIVGNIIEDKELLEQGLKI